MKHRFVIFRLPFGGDDEFKPLEGRPEYRTAHLRPQDYTGGAQVLILPGSGRTVDDLAYFRAHGGERIIREHLSAGGIVVGICGGYQMLGERLNDPLTGQGSCKFVQGLGYLPLTTTYGPKMLKTKTTAKLLVGAGAGEEVWGWEARSGHSEYTFANQRRAAFLDLCEVRERQFLEDKPTPAVVLPGLTWTPGSEQFDGLVSTDRRIWGTYLHCIFHNEAFRRSFFASLP